MDKKLIKAIKDQLGCDTESELIGTLEDVARGGADAGWSGFTYYSETDSFYKKNQKLIIEHLDQEREDFGEKSLIGYIKSFRCLGDLKGNCDYSEDEIATTLYGSKNSKKYNMRISNALAWAVLESLAFSLDGQDEADKLEILAA